MGSDVKLLDVYAGVQEVSLPSYLLIHSKSYKSAREGASNAIKISLQIETMLEQVRGWADIYIHKYLDSVPEIEIK